MRISVTGLVSNTRTSFYPIELQGAVNYIQEKAPNLIDQAQAQAGPIQIVLMLDLDSVPVYRSWLPPWSSYVLKEDLRKLPIEIMGLDCLGDETCVYTSELAKRNIQVLPNGKNAFWSPNKKAIFFSVEVLKTCPEKGHLYEEVSALCFELGNASENQFYQSKRLRNLSQCDFIQEVELKEREIHEATGKLLKEIGIPNEYNPHRFPFPEKAFLMAMEVFGHIEMTNRFYCQVKGVSLPPPKSLWENPINDREELQSLIYQMGLVHFGDGNESSMAKLTLSYREARMVPNSPLDLNWKQFKSLCNS